MIQAWCRDRLARAVTATSQVRLGPKMTSPVKRSSAKPSPARPRTLQSSPTHLSLPRLGYRCLMWQEAALGEDRGGRLDWLDLSDLCGPAAQFAIELPIPAVQAGLRPQAERIRSSAMRWDGQGLLNGRRVVGMDCTGSIASASTSARRRWQVAGAMQVRCSAVQCRYSRLQFPNPCTRDNARHALGFHSWFLAARPTTCSA